MEQKVPSVAGTPPFENTRSPLTAQISSSFARKNLVYFSCVDATVFCNTIPDLLTVNVLRAPTIGGGGGGGSVFQRTDEAKSFRTELFPVL